MTQETVVIYILYPNISNPREVLLLKKNSKSDVLKKIANKLIGLGGKVEPKKDGVEFPKRIINCCRRELREEINLELDEKHTIVISGKAFFQKQNRIVYFLKLALPDKINKKYANGNEGIISYYPINYYKEHSDEFPERDSELLDLMFSHDEKYFDRNILE